MTAKQVFCTLGGFQEELDEVIRAESAANENVWRAYERAKRFMSRRVGWFAADARARNEDAYCSMIKYITGKFGI